MYGRITESGQGRAREGPLTGPRREEARLLGQADRCGGGDGRGAREVDEGADGDQSRCTKVIDTLAAEWPAKTNYLYMTYNGTEDEAKPTKAKKALVLGAGPVQDRQLGGVRLGDDEHGLGAEGQRRRGGDRGQLQPGDRLHRLRHERQALLRGAHGREATRRSTRRRSRWAWCSAWGGRYPNDLALELDQNGVSILGTTRGVDRAGRGQGEVQLPAGRSSGSPSPSGGASGRPSRPGTSARRWDTP